MFILHTFASVTEETENPLIKLVSDPSRNKSRATGDLSIIRTRSRRVALLKDKDVQIKQEFLLCKRTVDIHSISSHSKIPGFYSLKPFLIQCTT